jgi:hypothetical protein
VQIENDVIRAKAEIFAEELEGWSFGTISRAFRLYGRSCKFMPALSEILDQCREAQKLIDQAIESGERVTLIFRHYLSSDLSAPAEPPYRFVVREGGMEGSTLNVSAAFFDMINTAWPRNFYTADFAPGIKYLR